MAMGLSLIGAGSTLAGLPSIWGFSDFFSSTPPLKERSVFDAEPLGHNVAGERTFAADVHAFCDIHVATKFAHHHEFLGGNIGSHGALASDGKAVLHNRDGAFDLTINVERFR